MQTVLIVEDEQVQREVLKEKIASAGLRAIVASDGEKGIETAISEKPDLILLDNRMPNMSGYAMLKRLREHDAWGEKVPVLFFSNVEPATSEEKEDLAAIAPTAYLLKSETDLDELISKIKRTLSSE